MVECPSFDKQTFLASYILSRRDQQFVVCKSEQSQCEILTVAKGHDVGVVGPEYDGQDEDDWYPLDGLDAPPAAWAPAVHSEHRCVVVAGAPADDGTASSRRRMVLMIVVMMLSAMFLTAVAADATARPLPFPRPAGCFGFRVGPGWRRYAAAEEERSAHGKRVESHRRALYTTHQ